MMVKADQCAIQKSRDCLRFDRHDWLFSTWSKNRNCTESPGPAADSVPAPFAGGPHDTFKSQIRNRSANMCRTTTPVPPTAQSRGSSPARSSQSGTGGRHISSTQTPSLGRERTTPLRCSRGTSPTVCRLIALPEHSDQPSAANCGRTATRPWPRCSLKLE